ncbi:sugar phosphate isomerase/epimerase [Klebsiella pneumoniae]|uniref:sugar phosphate isomerase/epimerase family protein n=1 Tax=Klebsiella pneumoniae TaxID=573 RepID=UPI001ABC1A54|nr:TIM barrel protein [Klebsiella pneumoniae]MBO3721279.1 TIM barrel protein [Klebsiella pneumoniae]HCM5830599.1 TIM barrel protein [Klebsiella pneumoniae]
MSIQFAITLYSFTPDFVTGRFTLEDCMQSVSDLGVKGIEFIPAMMTPGYPNLSKEWCKNFRSQMEKFELTPVCYGAYIDKGLHTGRDLTENEILNQTINDLENASKLGFGIMRTQYSLGVKLFEKVLPYAEKLNVKLAVEMHFPHDVNTPVWQDYFSFFDKVDTPFASVIPDMGIFQQKPHSLWIKEKIVTDMLQSDFVHECIELHSMNRTKEEVLERVQGQDESKLQFVNELFWMYKQVNIDDLKFMLPHVQHLHGKFYYVEENNTDENMPHAEIMKCLLDCNFKGTIACEYEGFHFDFEPNAKEQLNRYLKMQRLLINQYNAGGSK